MGIDWFADLVIVIGGINLFAVGWAFLMWRNGPRRKPSEQALLDIEQQAYLARLKRAA